jgi:penicillin-binding protein 2
LLLLRHEIVENAGFGADWAGPVASLLIEKYLRDSIAPSRKHLEEKLFNANIINPYLTKIDQAQKHRDSMLFYHRQESKRVADSLARTEDSLFVRKWFEKRFKKRIP